MVSIPRASGGVSGTSSSVGGGTGYSPRKRGCFLEVIDQSRNTIVFPAQAGVFPMVRMGRRRTTRIPRASGGVSDMTRAEFFWIQYSPRKRGCFRQNRSEQTPDHVFPAQAGVFPERASLMSQGRCIPRASGGVSRSLKRADRLSSYSPRKRGCFRFRRRSPDRKHVFPAQAGVFPRTA